MHYDKKGSVLLWTLMVSLVLSFIVVVIGTISYASWSRALSLVRKNQAYLTARSAVNLAVDQIIKKTEAGNMILSLIHQNENNSFTTNHISFDNNMGECTLSGALINPDLVKITGTATVGRCISNVSVYLKQNSFWPPLYELFPELNTPPHYQWIDWPTPDDKALIPIRGIAGNAVNEIGSGSEKDSFYYVGADTDFSDNDYKFTLMKPIGTGNIYIFVRSGSTFWVGGIKCSGTLKTKDGRDAPSVFVILENNAGLVLNQGNKHNDIFVYVYSPYPGNDIKIFRQSFITGSVIANNRNLSVTGEYMRPANSVYIEPNGSIYLGKWRILKYEGEDKIKE